VSESMDIKQVALELTKLAITGSELGTAPEVRSAGVVAAFNACYAAVKEAEINRTH
jgi:hypothetical protein